jgi:hypothetical protein
MNSEVTCCCLDDAFALLSAQKFVDGEDWWVVVQHIQPRIVQIYGHELLHPQLTL